MNLTIKTVMMILLFCVPAMGASVHTPLIWKNLLRITSQVKQQRFYSYSTKETAEITRHRHLMDDDDDYPIVFRHAPFPSRDSQDILHKKLTDLCFEGIGTTNTFHERSLRDFLFAADRVYQDAPEKITEAMKILASNIHLKTTPADALFLERLRRYAPETYRWFEPKIHKQKKG